MKIAAIPAAAPATSRRFGSAAPNSRWKRRGATEPMVAPRYIEGPSRPSAPPLPNVATAAIRRCTRSRSRSGASRYASEVDGESPRPGPRSQRFATTSPTPGAKASSHSGRCATAWSNTPLRVRRSNPATAKPVTAPTSAAATTTWRDRPARPSNWSRRLIAVERTCRPAPVRGWPRPRHQCGHGHRHGDRRCRERPRAWKPSAVAARAAALGRPFLRRNPPTVNLRLIRLPRPPDRMRYSIALGPCR